MYKTIVKEFNNEELSTWIDCRIGHLSIKLKKCLSKFKKIDYANEIEIYNQIKTQLKKEI